MNYWTLARACTRYFRKRRLRDFQTLFPPTHGVRVLDVGGTPDIWDLIDYPADITLLNVVPPKIDNANRNARRTYSSALGDGRRLDFPDHSFDLAFSNSVIEHVGSDIDAAAFAKELQRVGRSFYCQTPNKWFPVEPHLGTVFLHWFPTLLKNYYVVRFFTLWGLMNKPTREQASYAISEIRLLTKSELIRLFPDAEIRPERFLFVFPKSYVALRRARIEASVSPVGSSTLQGKSAA